MNSFPFGGDGIHPRNMSQRRSMPAEQFERSIDQIPDSPGGGGGGGGTAPILPFTIQDVSDTGPRISVFFGTVEDLTPVDIATPLTLTPDTTNTIFLDCDVDADGEITDALVDINTTGVPADTWEKAYILIGYAIAAGTGIFQINQSLYFSQAMQACGRDPEDPETTPGVYEFFVR